MRQCSHCFHVPFRIDAFLTVVSLTFLYYLNRFNRPNMWISFKTFYDHGIFRQLYRTWKEKTLDHEPISHRAHVDSAKGVPDYQFLNAGSWILHIWWNSGGPCSMHFVQTRLESDRNTANGKPNAESLGNNTFWDAWSTKSLMYLSFSNFQPTSYTWDSVLQTILSNTHTQSKHTVGVLYKQINCELNANWFIIPKTVTNTDAEWPALSSQSYFPAWLNWALKAMSHSPVVALNVATYWPL